MDLGLALRGLVSGARHLKMLSKHVIRAHDKSYGKETGTCRVPMAAEGTWASEGLSVVTFKVRPAGWGGGHGKSTRAGEGVGVGVGTQAGGRGSV